MLDQGLKTDFIIEIIPNVPNFLSIHLCIIKIYLCVQLLLTEGRPQAPTLLGGKAAPGFEGPTDHELGLGVSWFHGSCKRYVSTYMNNITVVTGNFALLYETVPCRYAAIRTKIFSCKHLYITKTKTTMDQISFFLRALTTKHSLSFILYTVHIITVTIRVPNGTVMDR